MERRIYTALLTLLLTALVVSPVNAAIPKPQARQEVSKPQKDAKDAKKASNIATSKGKDLDKTLQRLREEYPDIEIPASSDVQWIASTGEGQEADIKRAMENGAVLYSPDPHQVAQYEDDIGDGPTEKELRDAQMAQYWLDVKEDLTIREVDKKALALVKDFAGAKNAVPPIQGQNGSVSYTYGDHIPKIICRTNRITDIALQPGEKVTAVHAGDTTRWLISPAKSGSGEVEVIHVVVKPLMPDISTNLLVMTDKRTYNLDLVSSVKDFIPSVRFNYPGEMTDSWNSFIADSKKKQGEVVLSEGSYNLSPDDLDFGYVITKGKELPWSPTRVFDDGVKTYIEMPAKYRALEAPVLLFYEGQQQKLVNYRVKDRFYVIDRIMTKKAVLIAGKSRVVIERRKEKAVLATGGGGGDR